MQLFNANHPVNRSYIIWEHVVKTVFALVGTFALLIFGPMIMGGRNTRHGGGDTAIHILDFFMSNLWIQVLICCTVALVYNFKIYRKNNRVNYLISAEVFNDNIRLMTNTFYFNRPNEVIVAPFDLKVKILSKYNDVEGRYHFFEFIHQPKNEKICCIKSNTFLYENMPFKIRELIQELKKRGTKVEQHQKKHKSAFDTIFK